MTRPSLARWIRRHRGWAGLFVGAMFGGLGAYAAERAVRVIQSDGAVGVATVASGLVLAGSIMMIQIYLATIREFRATWGVRLLGVRAQQIAAFGAVALITPLLYGGWPAVVGFCAGAYLAVSVLTLIQLAIARARIRRDPAAAEQTLLRSSAARSTTSRVYLEQFIAIPGQDEAVDALWVAADALSRKRAGNRRFLLTGDDTEIKPVLARATARQARAVFIDTTELEPEAAAQIDHVRRAVVVLVRDVDGPDRVARLALMRELLAETATHRRLVIATALSADTIDDGTTFDRVLEIRTPAPAAAAAPTGAVQAQRGALVRLRGAGATVAVVPMLLGVAVAAGPIAGWMQTHPPRPLPHTLTAVLATPPANDRLTDPKGDICPQPGSAVLSTAGVYHTLNSNAVAAVAWSGAASAQFGWVAGSRALGYVTNRPTGMVPRDGLFVIGVYRSASAAEAAERATGGMNGLGHKLGAMPLPSDTRYRVYSQNDNLVLFQLLDSRSDANAVVAAVANGDADCELDATP